MSLSTIICLKTKRGGQNIVPSIQRIMVVDKLFSIVSQDVASVIPNQLQTTYAMILLFVFAMEIFWYDFSIFVEEYL